MGLLSRISSELPVQAVSSETHKTGLLAKSSQLCLKPVLRSFSEFCRANSLAHSALFSLVHGSFVITECEGLDALSVARSVSSRDFWNGMSIGTDEVRSFSKSDAAFSAFYQFFSPAFKDRICGLHFLKVSETCIFMTVDTESCRSGCLPAGVLRTSILQYLSASKETSEDVPYTVSVPGHADAVLLLLSVKIAINEAVRESGLSDAVLQNAVFSAVYAEIVSLLKTHFPSPNMCGKSSGGEIKIGLYAHSGFDDSLLQFHITRELSPVLSSFSHSIVLINAGTASSSDDVRRFMAEG